MSNNITMYSMLTAKIQWKNVNSFSNIPVCVEKKQIIFLEIKMKLHK